MKMDNFVFAREMRG